MREPIYLDNHATTPLDPRVLDAMLPYLTGSVGNPASPHAAGDRNRVAVDAAREQVAALVGAGAGGVIWTASATEANNLAIRGLARSSSRRRVVSTVIEHPSVLAPLRALREDGFDVVLLEVDSDGRVKSQALSDEVNEDTLLVSVAAANGEVGTTQDLAPISEIARSVGAFFHTDASQAVGTLRLDAHSLGIDLMTVSAHKMYGPQGVGAVVVGPAARTALRSLTLGGDQEGGLRAGSVNVAGVIGFGTAAHLAVDNRHSDSIRIGNLRDRLMDELLGSLPGISVVGPEHGRLPTNLNLRVEGVEAAQLIANCPQVAFSAGSACSSGSPAPSHVLLGLGLDADAADECVRFGLGRFTTDLEIKEAGELLVPTMKRLRLLGRSITAEAAR